MLCPECRKEVEKGSVIEYRQIQQGLEKGRLGQEGDEAARGNESRTYKMAFPAKAGSRPCPV